MSFFKDITKITIGNIISNAVTLISFLLITNLLSQQEFGIYSIYRNYFDLIIMFCFSYFNYVLLRYLAEKKSSWLFKRILLIEIIIASLIIVFSYAFPNLLPTIIKKDLPAKLVLFTSYAIFTYSMYDLMRNFFQAVKKFNTYFWMIITTPIIYLIAVIIIYYLGILSVENIILTQTISWLVPTIITIPELLKTKLKETRVSLKRIMKYGLFSLAQTQILSLVYPILFFIFARRATEIDIGIFGFSYRIGGLAIEIFASAILTVLFPSFSEEQTKEVYKKYLNQITKYLVNYGIIVILGFAIFGNLLLTILFPKYTSAGTFIIILILAQVFDSTAGLIINFFKAREDYKPITKAFITRLVAGIILSYFFVNSIMSAAITILIYDFLFFTYALIIAYKKGIRLNFLITKEDVEYFKSKIK